MNTFGKWSIESVLLQEIQAIDNAMKKMKFGQGVRDVFRSLSVWKHSFQLDVTWGAQEFRAVYNMFIFQTHVC